METVERCLSTDGVALLHTIAGNLPVGRADPGSRSTSSRTACCRRLRRSPRRLRDCWSIEDVHNFGPDYDRTLMEWDRRFEAAWPQLAGSYDERFRRMWRYYLLSSAAGFRSRNIQLFQVAMTRTGAAAPPGRRST